MPGLPSLGGLYGRRNTGSGVDGRKIPVPLSAYVVNCGVYVDGKRLAGRWTHGAAIEEVRKRGEGFVWIGLHEPDAEQIQGIAQEFGLHELAVEDALEAHQRPKLEQYDDTLFMVLKTVRYVPHESPTTANEIVETGELMVFLGKDFVITVRHGNHSGLAHGARADGGRAGAAGGRAERGAARHRRPRRGRLPRRDRQDRAGHRLAGDEDLRSARGDRLRADLPDEARGAGDCGARSSRWRRRCVYWSRRSGYKRRRSPSRCAPTSGTSRTT